MSEPYPEPIVFDFEQALALIVPEGLTAKEEFDFLIRAHRVASWVANGVVNARRPDEWPPDGIEF